MNANFSISMVEGLILGAVQGLTEFLPVSSTAHLILVEKLMGYNEPSLFFNTAVQFASVLAIVVYFRSELLLMFEQFVKKQWSHIMHLLLSTVPILVIGVLVRDVIEIVHSQLWVIGLSLILVALLMWYAQTRVSDRKNMQQLSNTNAVGIGLFQAVALLPGISRSGITIVGGVLNRLSFSEAIKYSFLLGIPAIGAATVYELLQLQPQEYSLFLYPGYIASFISSFVVSLLSIHLTLGIVQKYQFTPFILYRILVGVLTLLVWGVSL